MSPIFAHIKVNNLMQKRMAQHGIGPGEERWYKKDLAKLMITLFSSTLLNRHLLT